VFILVVRPGSGGVRRGIAQGVEDDAVVADGGDGAGETRREVVEVALGKPEVLRHWAGGVSGSGGVGRVVRVAGVGGFGHGGS
jgi:hypothetical protein